MSSARWSGSRKLATIRENKAGRTVNPLYIGIAGAGKVAREQHIPAIRGNAAFELAACSHCSAPVDGVPNFATIEDMLRACPELDAVAICSPPQAHYDAALLALRTGKHVLMEKPPCPTVMQLDHLASVAERAGLTLFQTWHLRHAAAVQATQRWLMARTICGGRITWKEDVRRWHPGQKWLWQTDGFGVFDAGINALSVLTQVVMEPAIVQAANLFIPSNCQTPIAAEVRLACGDAEFWAEFDFRHTGETIWDIELTTDRGEALLSARGNTLTANLTELRAEPPDEEYPSVYRRFDHLISERRSDVDKRPLKLVADIFLVGRHFPVEPFDVDNVRTQVGESAL
jgi:D-galactose 1-dehydrogenase/L-arabinose 1- dehydrogenase